MTTFSAAAAILLAAVIGFAIHHASLCNVRAVADVLILHTIPGGSPHALPAYAALLAGTAVGLMVIRALVGNVPKIECTGDVCRTHDPRTV